MADQTPFILRCPAGYFILFYQAGSTDETNHIKSNGGVPQK